MADRNVLIVIPARGGSKGVPRKNLRTLNHMPLLSYVIKASLGANANPTVIVSTEDNEIALLAERFGARVIMRPAELSGDAVVIDPVIVHACEVVEKELGAQFDLICTVQPTSPLLKSVQIDEALALFDDPGIDTVISMTNDQHLRWTIRDGRYVPTYEARVNRQQLPPAFRETGAILTCRRQVMNSGARIGSSVAPLLLSEEQSIDIDSELHFQFCESVLRRRRIVMSVIGSQDTGLGHVYRTLMLAGDLVHHDIVFVCCERDALAQTMLREHHYRLVVAGDDQRSEAVLSCEPDLVINDILDTSGDDILAFRKAGIRVVNFEDMGHGAEVADMVFNALYPHQIPASHIHSGPRYFCLRDEFLHPPERRKPDEIKRIIFTFGGVDEANLAMRVLGLIADLLRAKNIAVDIILGPGFEHLQVLEALIESLDLREVEIIRNTRRISSYMYNADLAITSGGRTVYELCSVILPVLVICQNERETHHTFASSENGILNLGHQADVADEAILQAVGRLIEDKALRDVMISRQRAVNLRSGRRRVIAMILGLLNPAENMESAS